MTDVEQFTPAAIESHFEREGINYLRDIPGRYLALFGASADRPFDVQVWVSAEGDDHPICVVRMMTKQYFPAEDGPRLLGLLNQWHSGYRWPKVYLVPASGNGELVYLVAEQQYDLSAGIHPAGLDELIRTAVGASGQFFCHVHERYERPDASFVDVSELEQRWREAG